MVEGLEKVDDVDEVGDDVKDQWEIKDQLLTRTQWNARTNESGGDGVRTTEAT